MHLHTKASDGILSPAELVRRCKNLGFDLVSITDHDTFDAYKNIPESAIPLRILPGIEISSTYKDSDVHILGYGCDMNNEALTELVDMYLINRQDRAMEMIELLAKMDVEITWQDVAKHAGEKNLIARPHVAQALVEKGFVPYKGMAFDLYIGNNAPAYVPKKEVATEEVIRMIQAAGGVALVAHPGKLVDEDYVHDFIEMGMDGIEVWHPDHDFMQVKKFMEIAEKHALYMSGGTDFHGDKDRKIQLTNAPVDARVLESVITMYQEYLCKKKESMN